MRTDLQKGLSESEVKERQRQSGPNKLPEEKPLPKLKIFLSQFKSPLVYILLLAGFVTFAVGFFNSQKSFIDSAFIFFVVLLAAVIGFLQENKTSRTLDELKRIVKHTAEVLREGNYKLVSSEEVVPGDIIVLRPGSKVPADARITERHDLKVNEMALTGEWLSAHKKPEVISDKTPLADRDNMVYMGTVVEGGKGKAVVVATGLKTEIGRVAEMLKEVEEEQTPYQRRLAKFARLLGGIILFLALLIFVLGVWHNQEPVEMFLVAVAMAVAAIPEGLPAAVTLVFTFGMREILKRKGLVRKLIAAETLGSTSVIAADKTATLTAGKMEIAEISAAQEDHFLALKIAAFCSEAFVENIDHPMEKWQVRGRPTDRALLLGAVQGGLNIKELLEQEPKIDEIPFEPAYKYSAALHDLDNKERAIYLMGAPEVVFAKAKIKARDLSELKNREQELTSKGYRVVALAYKKVSKELSQIADSDLKALTFVGFVALHDPIRPRAQEAIETCRRAGMTPIIVTGDHRLTAKAVAEKVGFKVSDENILEGKDLEQLSDEEFKKVFKNIQIYARVTPEQKLRIIDAWQGSGEVVAMTGDGVNDAPALKKANIGVALGSGTEVAKEAADLILLSDDFEIIVVAVEEGRRIIDNIRKIITYLLTGGFTEVMLIGAAIIFRLPLPVLAGQILWKNLIESTPAAMALTFEPKEKGIMARKPEPLHLPLLTKRMKVMIFVIGLLTDLLLFAVFWWMYNSPNYGPAKIDLIRSVMFAGLAVDSFLFIFSFRNLRLNIWQYNPFSNMVLNVVVLTAFLALLAAIYLPPFQALLRTAPFGFFEWSILLAYALVDIILIEIAKWYYRQKNA